MDFRFAYVPGTSTINVRDMNSGELVGEFDYFKGVPDEYKDEFEARMSTVSDSWIRGFERNLEDVRVLATEEAKEAQATREAGRAAEAKTADSRGGSPTVGDYEAGRAGRERVEYARQTAEDLAAEEARQARVTGAKNAVTNDLEASRLPPVKPSGVTTPTQARNYDKTNAKPGQEVPKPPVQPTKKQATPGNLQPGQEVPKLPEPPVQAVAPLGGLSGFDRSQKGYGGPKITFKPVAGKQYKDYYDIYVDGEHVDTAHYLRMPDEYERAFEEYKKTEGTKPVEPKGGLSSFDRSQPGYPEPKPKPKPPKPPEAPVKGSQITKAEQMRQIYEHVKDGKPDDWLLKHKYELDLFKQFNVDGTPKTETQPKDIVEPASPEVPEVPDETPDANNQVYTIGGSRDAPIESVPGGVPSIRTEAEKLRSEWANLKLHPKGTGGSYDNSQRIRAEWAKLQKAAKRTGVDIGDLEGGTPGDVSYDDASPAVQPPSSYYDKTNSEAGTSTEGEYKRGQKNNDLAELNVRAQELLKEFNAIRSDDTRGGQKKAELLKAEYFALARQAKALGRKLDVSTNDFLYSDSRLKMIKPTAGILNGVQTKY